MHFICKIWYFVLHVVLIEAPNLHVDKAHKLIVLSIAAYIFFRLNENFNLYNCNMFLYFYAPSSF